jgi:hypothetical protein
MMIQEVLPTRIYHFLLGHETALDRSKKYLKLRRGRFHEHLREIMI